MDILPAGMNEHHNTENRMRNRLFAVLFFAGLFAIAAGMPYAFTLQQDVIAAIDAPLATIVAAQLIQTTVLLLVLVGGGLFFSRRLGWGTPLLEKCLRGECGWNELKEPLGSALRLGLFAGLIIALLDYFLFFSAFPDGIGSVVPPLWQRILASFYGGIFEEIAMRFFIVSATVYTLAKLFTVPVKAVPATFVWPAIVFAAILFGALHLPVTASLTDITPLVVFRAVLLNGVGGIIFGWLYWKRGLLSAMVAHFCTDIVIIVLLPLFME